MSTSFRTGASLILVALSVSPGGCGEPARTTARASGESIEVPAAAEEEARDVGSEDPLPVSSFVRRIHEDGRGHLWLGTNGDGVARYDGEKLVFFGLDEGFGGTTVRAIAEDEDSTLWFATENGLTKLTGESFENLTTADGLIGNDVWSLLVDSQQALWVGTLDGVSRLHDGRFTHVPLPKSKPDEARGVSTANAVHSIMEDKQGRIWFGTSGGARIYDDGAVTTISSADGLCGDTVNAILEASDGAIWFATHHNGVCRFDGETFEQFTEADGVRGTEAWSLHEDRAGNIWFPIENSGVYRFDGESFSNFAAPRGLDSNAIQSIYEDRAGRVWLGGWKGLFRYDQGAIVAVHRSGPWPTRVSSR